MAFGFCYALTSWWTRRWSLQRKDRADFHQWEWFSVHASLVLLQTYASSSAVSKCPESNSPSARCWQPIMVKVVLITWSFCWKKIYLLHLIAVIYKIVVHYFIGHLRQWNIIEVLTFFSLCKIVKDDFNHCLSKLIMRFVKHLLATPYWVKNSVAVSKHMRLDDTSDSFNWLADRYPIEMPSS